MGRGRWSWRPSMLFLVPNMHSLQSVSESATKGVLGMPMYSPNRYWGGRSGGELLKAGRAVAALALTTGCLPPAGRLSGAWPLSSPSSRPEGESLDLQSSTSTSPSRRARPPTRPPSSATPRSTRRRGSSTPSWCRRCACRPHGRCNTYLYLLT